MRFWTLLVVAASLAGCAGSPPKPPMPIGEYRPINQPVATQRETFDFAYEGDVLGALPALSRVAPGLRVMPSLGQPSPLPIRVNLRGATLEEALRAISAQCGTTADVVLTSNPHNPSAGEAFIRFRTAPEAAKRRQSRG